MNHRYYTWDSVPAMLKIFSKSSRNPSSSTTIPNPTKLLSDPRTVVTKKVGTPATDDSLFVVSETLLPESKLKLPAIVHGRPPDFDHQGMVIDVLSVGSRTRPEYVSFYQFGLGIVLVSIFFVLFDTHTLFLFCSCITRILLNIPTDGRTSEHMGIPCPCAKLLGHQRGARLRPTM